VAWIQGTIENSDLSVTPVIINEQGQNPCSASFSIDNGAHSDYLLAGCGGDSMWLTQNEQLVASCSSQPDKIGMNGPGNTIVFVDQLYCRS
jgi:hypothetical protein